MPNYNIGNNTYDIDPAWSNILYRPLELTDLNEGFVYKPQGFDPVLPAPEAPAAASGGYLAPGGGNGGGGDGPSAGGGGITSGVGNTDYNDASFWGGNFAPNEVSIGKALKGFAPVAASFMQSPLRTTIRGLVQDPINDKAFQAQLGSYLSEMAPDISVKDFISAYKDQIKSNLNSKINAMGTIQGMALGLDPSYQGSYETMMQQGLNPHDFARAYNEAMGLGMDAQGLSNAVMNDYTAYGATYNPVGLVNGVHQGGFTSIEGLSKAVENRQAFETKLDNVVNQYGYNSWDDFANGGQGGGDRSGGMGGGYSTGDRNGIGGIGSEGNKSGNSYGTPGTDAAFGGGYSQGGYTGGREGMAGNGGGGDGGGSSGNSGSDGDSSNNGNGAHD